jgi:hypothetical protein
LKEWDPRTQSLVLLTLQTLARAYRISYLDAIELSENIVDQALRKLCVEATQLQVLALGLILFDDLLQLYQEKQALDKIEFLYYTRYVKK